MISKTFSVMMIFSFFSAIFTGRLENIGVEFVSSLSDAVSLCISLLGMMCFWSGFMNVLKESGAVKWVSIILKPILTLIFSKENLKGENLDNLSSCFAANFLGLGNAALPLGIKAIKGFERNNKTGVAGSDTIMFSVLATVPFQLIPTTLIAMRTGYGAKNPFDVVPFIWICSVIINIFAVVVCKLFLLSARVKK